MASSFGGTVEALPEPVVLVNQFGGTDTLTHAGYALLVDPFVAVQLAAYASTMSAAPVQVIRYFGTISGVVGEEQFATYPGIAAQVAVFTAEELRQLDLDGLYTFPGFVAAAKDKLPDPTPVLVHAGPHPNPGPLIGSGPSN